MMEAVRRTPALLSGVAVIKRFLLPVVAAALAIGGALWLAGQPDTGGEVWAAATALVLLTLIIDIGVSFRRGEFGLDLIAALAIMLTISIALVVLSRSIVAVAIVVVILGILFVFRNASLR